MSDRESLKGMSPGLPMYPCPDCLHLAMYDVFGNTDHVCTTGPRAERQKSLFPYVPSGPTTTSWIELTSRGPSNGFYDLWQRWVNE